VEGSRRGWSGFISPGRRGLGCTSIGRDWTARAVLLDGVVSQVQAYGWQCRWRDGSVGVASGSVRAHLRTGLPGSVRSAREQGGGGVASRAGCHARSCVVRCRGRARRAGTRHTRYARWAARRCRSGSVGVACMVGLGRVWPGELTRWIEMVLAAK
jgi:hypothetical protein